MSDKKISELPIASTISSTDLSVLVSSGTNYQFAFSTLLQFIGSGLSVGANISFGTTLPQNTTGKDGDVFINTSAGSFAQRIGGAWTIAYTLPSSTGGSTDGTVLYGLGVPASTAGNNNDTYINTGTGIFYKKSGGGWSQVFSMQTGPAGAQGSSGANGTNGANGKTILNGTTNPSNLSTGTDGDFYINTSTFTFFGPKAGGVWPAGTSLAGADGATGPAGADGHGVPTGGTVGQVLTKIDGTDYHTEWGAPAGGGSVSGLAPKEILFGAADGTVQQNSDLQFDPSTKSLYKNVEAAPASGGNIYFFGTSITGGTGASSGTNRFSSLVSTLLGLTEQNHGIPNSTTEKRSPIDYAGAENMVDNITGNLPTKGSADKYIVLEGGINDLHYGAGGNYTPTNFQTDLETIMGIITSKGWSAGDVLILSPTFTNPTVYGTTGVGGGPILETDHEAYRAASLAVSVEHGTMYFDIFNYILRACLKMDK